MAIVSTDLVKYGSASMPENDTGTSGGAISLTTKVDMIEIPGGNDTIDVLSDGADTRTATITGRNAAGTITSETLTLNGTTPVTGSITFERLLKVVLSATDGSRSVTVRESSGDVTIATLAAGVQESRRMFYDASSSDSTKNIYEKEFWKNEHASLALSSAKVTLTAHSSDPENGIQIALAASKGDTATVTNRVTAPAGLTFVDDGVDQDVPTDSLASGEAIGVWVAMKLGANDAAFKGSFTTKLSGTTT